MNKKIRIILIVVGILVIVGGFAGYLAVKFTAELPNAADRFFVSLKEQKFESAYALTSRKFHSNTSFEAFVDLMRQNTLDTFTGAKWTQRTIENDIATLEGSVTTQSGGTIPMIVDFVKEDGRWKVFGIHPKEDATVGQVELPETELTALAHATVMRFADAVARKDFSNFYDAAADAWKSETNPGELRDAFQPVIQDGFDFFSLKNVNPLMADSPSIDENGVLTFTVEYPTPQGKISFLLGYLEEKPQQWKLIRLEVW